MSRVVFQLSAWVLWVFVLIVLWVHTYLWFLPFLWTGSMISFFLSYVPKKEKSISFSLSSGYDFLQKKISWTGCIIFIVCMLPVFVRIMHMDYLRGHGDEFLSGYFSAVLDIHQNFFSGVPSEAAWWVCQFPLPYFFFQHIFFSLFGATYITLKWSVLPYVLIISVMIYAIMKLLFRPRIAIISVILYAWFAPSVYIETLGLMFVSSTAVMLVFLYCLLQAIQTKREDVVALAGILCGWCYLLYHTSYIALPILCALYIMYAVHTRSFLPLRHLMIALLGSILVMGPYLVYAYRTSNYFLARIEQVSVLSGSWSDDAIRIREGLSWETVIWNQIRETTRSMYIDGIGGHGGYDFGHRALFPPFSLVLMIVGFMSGIWSMRKQRKIIILYGVIGASFFLMVYSIPPPAFHRFSLAFPFLCMIMAMVFVRIEEIFRRYPRIVLMCVVVLSMAYVFVNEQTFFRYTSFDLPMVDISMAHYIADHYPDRPIFIAAFPTFSLKKTIHFLTKHPQSVHSDYHDNYLQHFPPQGPYVYIIWDPWGGAFTRSFIQKAPDAKRVMFGNEYVVITN